jgi:flagellar protein FlaG
MDIKAAQPLSSVSAAPARRIEHNLQHKMAVVAEQLQDFLRSGDRNLEFRVDGDSHTTVITVRNASTGDVIRQIPTETALRIMRHLNADCGTLVDLTA